MASTTCDRETTKEFAVFSRKQILHYQKMFKQLSVFIFLFVYR